MPGSVSDLCFPCACEDGTSRYADGSVSHPFPQHQSKRPSIGSADERPNKKRSLRACETCRVAKTRCIPSTVVNICERCITTSTRCVFPESRRGRIKGSKNLKTLQKNGYASSAESMSGPSSSTLGHSTETAHLVIPGERRSGYQSPPAHNANGIETETPNSPARVLAQDVMDAIENGRLGHPRKLTRKLMNVIDKQFPVVRDYEEPDRGMKGSHEHSENPLASITGLAARGWDLADKSSRPTTEPKQLFLPAVTLPLEDAALRDRWTSRALADIMSEQKKFFEAGLYGSKRDVARGLDPVGQGMLSEERVKDLFDAFWQYVFPQWPILDPDQHTPWYIRSHSALLFTTVLALGATALATLPQRSDDQVSEALNLHAHVERLTLVVYTTGARSIEIIQAQILLSRWGSSPRTNVCEMRRIRAGMIPRMAQEIGLDQNRQYGKSETQKHWNDIRTRVYIIINEYRFSIYTGREPMDLSIFELTDEEIGMINGLGPRHPMSALPASYQLHLFVRDVTHRLKQIKPNALGGLALEAELLWVKTYTERWIKEWCSDSHETRVWHLKHDALANQLLLAAKIASRNSHPTESSEQQKDLLRQSITIFTEAIQHSRTMHMSHRASVLPFFAAIILRLSDRRDLVMQLALRLAGDPTGPHVPTFVREAGHQMLAMLCVNRPSPEKANPYFYEVTTCDPSNCSQPITLPSRPPQPNLEGINALDTLPDFSIFDSLQELGNTSTHFTDPGNLFGFEGIFDFPFTPGTSFPPNLEQAPLIPPNFATELNALTACFPPLVDNQNISTSGVTGLPWDTPSDARYNLSGPANPSGYGNLLSLGSPSGPVTSIQTGSTQSEISKMGEKGENPRRQALLDTISQLVHLATSME